MRVVEYGGISLKKVMIWFFLFGGMIVGLVGVGIVMGIFLSYVVI